MWHSVRCWARGEVAERTGDACRDASLVARHACCARFVRHEDTPPGTAGLLWIEFGSMHDACESCSSLHLI